MCENVYKHFDKIYTKTYEIRPIYWKSYIIIWNREDRETNAVKNSYIYYPGKIKWNISTRSLPIKSFYIKEKLFKNYYCMKKPQEWKYLKQFNITLRIMKQYLYANNECNKIIDNVKCQWQLLFESTKIYDYLLLQLEGGRNSLSKKEYLKL